MTQGKQTKWPIVEHVTALWRFTLCSVLAAAGDSQKRQAFRQACVRVEQAPIVRLVNFVWGMAKLFVQCADVMASHPQKGVAMLVINEGQTDAPIHTNTRGHMFQMPVFKPGVKVVHAGRTETVSHVVLRRREMMVHLVGRDEPVKPERLTLTPTLFSTERRPEVLTWFL